MNRNRKSRKARLNNELRMDWAALEPRQLMAAEVLKNVNLMPNATLLFDSGVTQFYDQGTALVAVEGGQAREILVDTSDGNYLGGYGLDAKFVQLGQRTLIVDTRATFIYDQGAEAAKTVLTNCMWPEVMVSGQQVIVRGTSRAGKQVAYLQNDAGEFVEMTPPAPGARITDIDGLQGGVFLVAAVSDGLSRSYFFDTHAMIYHPLNLEPGGIDDKTSRILDISGSTSLCVTGGQLYFANVLTLDTWKVEKPDSDQIGNQVAATTFGGHIFIATFQEVSGTPKAIRVDRIDTVDGQLIANRILDSVPIFTGNRDTLSFFATDRRLVAAVSDDDSGFAFQYDPLSGAFFEPVQLAGRHLIAELSSGEIVLTVNDTIPGYRDFRDLPSKMTTYATGDSGIRQIAQIDRSFARATMPFGNHLLTLANSDSRNTMLLSLNVGSGSIEELKIIDQRLANLDGYEPAANYYTMTPRGLVFQSGDDETGSEPWITDGTPEGTHLLADVVPGPGGSGACSFRNTDGGLEFVAKGDDGRNMVYRYLWASGETAPLAEMPEFDGGSHEYFGLWSTAYDSVQIGNKVLFRAFDGNKLALFATDGTPDGTVRLSTSLVRGTLTRASGKAVFLRDSEAGRSIWTSDGTPEGTSKVIDLPNTSFVVPFRYSDYGLNRFEMDERYAVLKTVSDSGLAELWVTDGTAEGTRFVYQVEEGFVLATREDPIVLNGVLYFAVQKPSDPNMRLMAVDLQTGESRILKQVSAADLKFVYASSTGMLYFHDRMIDGDRLAIFATDGTATRLIKQTGDYFPAIDDNHGVLNGRLFSWPSFFSDDDLKFYYDSPETGEWTSMQARHVIGDRFTASGFVHSGDWLYFLVERQGEGATVREIWRMDGTIENMKMVVSSDQIPFPFDDFTVQEYGGIRMLTLKKLVPMGSASYRLTDDGGLVPIQPIADYVFASKVIGGVGDSIMHFADDPRIGFEPHFQRIIPIETLVIEPIGDAEIDEHAAWSIAVKASGSTSPVTFSLAPGAPAGMTIDPVTGVLAWTPGESDGGHSQSVTVKASSAGLSPQSAEMTFLVSVRETNTAPHIVSIPGFDIQEGRLLTTLLKATDPDLPVQKLQFSLVGTVPAGMSLNPDSGFLQWTPDESQGGRTYTVRARVTDNGSVPLSDEMTFTIMVRETNSPPAIQPVPDLTVDEGQTVSYQVVATDPDAPAQTLFYRFVGTVPAGASIDPATGRFQWHVPVGAASSRITVEVTDNGSPASQARVSFLVNVRAVPLQISRFVPKFGRRTITSIGIELTGDVDSASAKRNSNYRIISAGRDGRFGTRDDRSFGIRSATVSSNRRTITLLSQQTLATNQRYRLTILDSVLDSMGRKLDGDRDGQFGGSAVALIVNGSIS